MARKGGKARQKPEAEQDGGKNVGEKCGVPGGKCAAKRREIIWRKGGTNNVENRRRI